MAGDADRGKVGHLVRIRNETGKGHEFQPCPGDLYFSLHSLNKQSFFTFLIRTDSGKKSGGYIFKIAQYILNDTASRPPWQLITIQLLEEEKTANMWNIAFQLTCCI